MSIQFISYHLTFDETEEGNQGHGVLSKEYFITML